MCAGPPEPEELAAERRQLRRLRWLMDLTGARLMQEKLTREEAFELVTEARRQALAMFPDKSLAFELIYRPRLMRIVRERWPATGLSAREGTHPSSPGAGRDEQE